MQNKNPFLQAASLALVMVFIILLFFTGDRASSPAPVLAQQAGPGSKYLTVRSFTTADGKGLTEYIINGPPKPPAGYEAERQAVDLPEPGASGASKTLTVPAYDWVFGCSSVSGAMIAAYYDRNGYPNMYTGPTNGGVMPMTNSVWGTWTDSLGDVYPNIPLAASHKGVDGRTTRGAIDDYWVSYGSTARDPYITGGWTQHAWGTAIGDYMKTSQSAYKNTDGSTNFLFWTSNAAPLTCAEMADYGVQNQDGTYGRKLFYNARGYTVTDCYNQKTDNNAGGFGFAQYKAEIDAGHPVMLNLYGHTIVGVGYNDSTFPQTIYINDTWDHSTHSMAWGASYQNLPLLSVSIVHPVRTSSQYRVYLPFVIRPYPVSGAPTFMIQSTDGG